jgi:prophage regulatory protein
VSAAERLLRRPEVEHRTGLGRSTIYEGMAAGTFPLARRVPGEMSVWWVESEVAAWIADRINRSAPVGTVVGKKPAGRKKAA